MMTSKESEIRGEHNASTHTPAKILQVYRKHRTILSKHKNIVSSINMIKIHLLKLDLNV